MKKRNHREVNSFVWSQTVSARAEFKPIIWLQNRLCYLPRVGGELGEERKEEGRMGGLGTALPEWQGREDEGRQLPWVRKEQPSAVLQPSIPFVARDCFGPSNAQEVGVPAVAQG